MTPASPAREPVPVTLAEIARIAGVGRAAVSNWRRRHEDFPSRIGGTDVSPQFALAEVEEWLRANNKLKDSVALELLWPRFEALGSREESGLAIAEAGQRMRSRGGRAAPGGRTLPTTARELAAEAARLGRQSGPKETFDFLLQRWLDAHVRQISITPPPLAALMADLALRARGDAGGEALSVLDPACGSGHLLIAAAHAYRRGPVALAGCDRDPALAELASARLAYATDATDATVDVRRGDALRADPHSDAMADVVLCNPPFNERDWGYEELATDPRWAYGLPPRTEPELAWVQHCVAHLRPGGAAVVLLPPAVASRKAGRRIRGALLRTGLLRAVIALPPGSAPPHSVSLHMWVLRAPSGAQGSGRQDDVLLVDAARFGKPGGREPGPHWEALGSCVRAAFDVLDRPSAALPPGTARIPLIDLLDDETDVTPGRYVSAPSHARGHALTDTWAEFHTLLDDLQKTGTLLADLDLADANADAPRPPTTTVGELARAGALTMRGGQQPPDGAVATGSPEGDGLPLLTVPDLLLTGEPRAWLPSRDAAVVAEEGDVIVPGVIRAFHAWVHHGPPVALGPQLYALRVDPERLDADFLAGCLRAPSNSRQAGTHTSTSSRVDVRKLFVLQLALEEQIRYGEVFGRAASFGELLVRLGGPEALDGLGGRLLREVSDLLLTAGLPGRHTAR